MSARIHIHHPPQHRVRPDWHDRFTRAGDRIDQATPWAVTAAAILTLLGLLTLAAFGSAHLVTTWIGALT